MVALCVAIVVGMYAATRGERVYWSVVSLMAAIAVWNAGTALRVVALPDSRTAGIFFAYYLGAVAIAPLWAILAARLTHVAWLSTRRAMLLGVPSACAYLAAVTNPYHHLYFQTDLPVFENGLRATAGPLLWIFTVWSYCLVVAGTALFIRSAWLLARSGQPLRGAAIATAAGLPIVIGFLRSVEITAPGSDFTPIAIAVSVSTLFFLHWQHQMRDRLPLARGEVIEHLGDGVIILDETGRILDSNPSADDIIGATPGSLRNRPYSEVVSESNVIIPLDVLEAAAGQLQLSPGPWIHSFETRDGRLIESTTNKVCGGDNDPVGFFMVLRDHSERRRMEHFLRQSQRMETMAGLSAGIAHEINNPLAYIRSNLNHIVELTRAFEEQFKETDDKKSDECGEMRIVAEECSDGIDRIGGIVDRMRRFSRMRPDEVSAIDLNEALSDALKMARMQTDPAMALRYDPDTSLPQVRASHGHIVQLLLNLCANARQAVEGVDQASIEIETCATETEVSIRIRDNGPGIPTRIRGRIFDPFFTTKSPGMGTGLGLPIAYGIAREHGGSLDFEESPSGGAEFTLRLPIDGRPEVAGTGD